MILKAVNSTNSACAASNMPYDALQDFFLVVDHEQLEYCSPIADEETAPSMRNKGQTTMNLLDILPAEIKLLMLCALDERLTLHNLIVEFPEYDAIYQNSSQLIQTSIALNPVLSRGFDFRKPARWLEVLTRSYRPFEDPLINLKAALQECYIQAATEKTIILSHVAHTELLELVDVVGWNVDKMGELDGSRNPNVEFYQTRSFQYVCLCMEDDTSEMEFQDLKERRMTMRRAQHFREL